jgi:hypothetical protein
LPASTPSSPPSSSTIPLPLPLAVDPSPASPPVRLPVTPHAPVTVPTAPSHAPHPRSPRQWTLAEILERCTTYEEYLQHRPIGFSGLTESWAVLDKKVRQRHHKQPKESWPTVFTRARSNAQQNSSLP